MPDHNREIWDFKFGVEVSARYHDWRRGTIEASKRFAKAATLVGAIVTLLTAFNPLDWAPHVVGNTIIALSALIAIINLWELAVRLDELALRHNDLYRRFSALQAKMAKHPDALLNEWQAEAAEIRRDEPPTMWAVYATCWNQTVERYHPEEKLHSRKIGRVANMLRNLFQFRPSDFPAA